MKYEQHDPDEIKVFSISDFRKCFTFYCNNMDMGKQAGIPRISVAWSEEEILPCVFLGRKGL